MSGCECKPGRAQPSINGGPDANKMKAMKEPITVDRVQLLPIVICGAIALMDGYDAQSMGYVVPAISADLHISRAALGPLLSSGLVGMVGGALAFGPLADRIGRKPVLLLSTIVFSLMSLGTATAGSLQIITVFRLLTGFGLGGALPNTIAMTA